VTGGEKSETCDFRCRIMKSGCCAPTVASDCSTLQNVIEAIKSQEEVIAAMAENSHTIINHGVYLILVVGRQEQ
jgi:hypothetical protein